MTKKQQENEVKYRLSIMMLLELKYKGQITNCLLYTSDAADEL